MEHSGGFASGPGQEPAVRRRPDVSGLLKTPSDRLRQSLVSDGNAAIEEPQSASLGVVEAHQFDSKWW